MRLRWRETMPALQAIVNENETSKALFKMLESRERSRSVTDVRQIFYQLSETNPKISADELIATFKKLEDLGMGSIIHGRDSNPTRFKWNYSLKDIAQKANGKEVALKPLDAPKVQRTQSAAAMLSQAVMPNKQHVITVFIVGDDVKEFTVPADKMNVVSKLLESLSKDAA